MADPSGLMPWSCPRSTPKSVKHRDLKEAIIEEVIKPTLPAKMIDRKTKFHVNPTGRFVVGGPFGDAGLTGRKIIVDTYGGMGQPRGRRFQWKKIPSKVDRSAAYFARYVAKNIVASKVASRCEVQVAYAIGVAEPMGIYVTTFGTGHGRRREESPRSVFEDVRLPSEGHCGDARPIAPHLHPNRCLRPLRSDREVLHLGEVRTGQRSSRSELLPKAS